MILPWWAWAIGAWYLALSLITLIAFFLDKRAAVAGRWRTPERRLHLFAALGGWPGSILAFFLIRHKNRKPTFVATTVLLAATHTATWVWVWLR